MISDNAIGSFVPSLQALVQRIRQECLAMQEFQSGDEDVIGGVTTVLDETEGILDELKGLIDKIAADDTLSAVGKHQKVTVAVESVYSRLRFVQKAATTRRDASESAHREAYAIPKSPGDPTVSAVYEMEIRQRVRGLPVQDRMRLYQHAVETRNITVLNAITNPVFADEFLSDPTFKNFVDRVDRDHLEAKEPTKWARLETLKRAAEWLMLLGSAISLAMENYGKLPTFPTPPVGKADLKMKDQTAPPAKSKSVDVPPKEQAAFV